MNAIVSDKRLELAGLINGDFIYKVFSDYDIKNVNIYFDEPMCIDLNKFPFIEELSKIFKAYVFKPYNEETLYFLESSLNNLLNKAFSSGALFTGTAINFLKNKDGMLYISDDNYDNIRRLLAIGAYNGCDGL